MEFGIDFDDASKEWRKNKKNISNGWFVYTCNYIHSNGKKCNKLLYSYNLSKKNKNYNDNFIYCGKNYNLDNDFYCKKHLYIQKK